MKALNWILAFLDRWDQRRWRRYIRKNRVRYPTDASIGPRLHLQSGKYLDIRGFLRGKTSMRGK